VLDELGVLAGDVAPGRHIIGGTPVSLLPFTLPRLSLSKPRDTFSASLFTLQPAFLRLPPAFGKYVPRPDEAHRKYKTHDETKEDGEGQWNKKDDERVLEQKIYQVLHFATPFRHVLLRTRPDIGNLKRSFKFLGLAHL
jgi:hypothetical protein